MGRQALKIPGLGGRVTIINCHAPTNSGDNRELREAYYRDLNEELINNSGKVILAGDMNATPDSEPVSILIKHWTNATDTPPAATAPATNPKSRIDYVFFRPTQCFRLISARVINESLASDHRPVFAELEFNPPVRDKDATRD